MSISKMRLSDPFDETTILINSIIDKFEQTYLCMSSESFSGQVNKIEKDIKLLALCVSKSQENQEKIRRTSCIKKLEQRVNNIKTLFLTRTVETGQTIKSTFMTNFTTNSDTEQLLVRQMINEQNNQLDQIGKSVSNLKQIANTVENELTSSNKILDDIAIKVKDTDVRLEHTTKGIKRLNQKVKNSCCCKTAIIIGTIIIIFIVVLVCII